MEASPPPAKQDAHRNEPRLGKPVGQVAESRLDDRGEAGKGEHEPGGCLIIEAVRGDQEGQDGGQRAAVDVARKMPKRHKEKFLFVHDDNLCPQAGRMRGRAFPAARKSGAAATARWIVGNLRRKARPFLGEGPATACGGFFYKRATGMFLYVSTGRPSSWGFP